LLPKFYFQLQLKMLKDSPSFEVMAIFAYPL